MDLAHVVLDNQRIGPTVVRPSGYKPLFQGPYKQTISYLESQKVVNFVLKGYDREVCDVENAIQFLFACLTRSHAIPFITVQKGVSH